MLLCIALSCFENNTWSCLRIVLLLTRMQTRILATNCFSFSTTFLVSSFPSTSKCKQVKRRTFRRAGSRRITSTEILRWPFFNLNLYLKYDSCTKSLSLIGIQTKDKARVLGQIRENCNTSNFHTTNSENCNTTSFHPMNFRKIVSSKNFRKHYYSYVYIVLYVGRRPWYEATNKNVLFTVYVLQAWPTGRLPHCWCEKNLTPELFNVDYCTFRVSVSFAGSWPSVMSMEYTRDSSSMVVHSSP